MDDSSSGSGRRVQVRLGDLGLVVVGSAVIFDVIRRSRAGWTKGVPNQAQVLGLVVLTMGVGLGLILMGQGGRRLRDRSRPGWLGALAWRFLAMGVLFWLGLEIADDLQPTPLYLSGISALSVAMKLNVDPLMTSLGLVGLILALIPPETRPRQPRLKPGWGTRLSVVLAVVGGLGFVAAGEGIFPYMVLLALEFVQNAMPRVPLVWRPIVFDRLNLACLEALPGLSGCLLTAIWIDDDLRATASDPMGSRTPRSPIGILGRVTSVVLAAGGSGFVLFQSIPKLSPPVAEGIASLFEPSTVATIVLGFAGLALGISARGASRLVVPTLSAELSESPGSGLGRWPWRILGVLIGLVALDNIVTAVHKIRGDEDNEVYVSFTAQAWMTFLEGPLLWLGFPKLTNPWDILFYQPSAALMMILTSWMVYRLIRLFLSKISGRASALDLVAADRLTWGRFLGWWLGLTTLMLACLPVLAVTGVTLTHHLVRWMVK